MSKRTRIHPVQFYLNDDEQYILEEKYPDDVTRYHSRIKPERRKKQLLFDFLQGKRKIMIATSAFSMGIDVSDIELVVHFNAPISMTDYIQQIGRAGRDGKKSTALLLWHEYDFTINRRLLKENQMELKGAELKERLHALEALHDYACENHKCRWGMIREFFGEKSGKRCKKRCDNCKNR